MNRPAPLIVTGANGFIGRSLVNTLSARQVPVHGITREAVGDIGPDTDWRPVLEGVDAVIHAAARVHRMRDEMADEYRRVNLEGTMRLAMQAAEFGVRRVVFISTIKVTDDLRDPYADSKYEAERALKEIAESTGLEVVIVRPPLVYGPGVRGNFRRLVGFVQKGIPLPLGIVDNRRSLVALDNLVDLLIRCVDHPNAAGQVFPVSDGEDLSTPELIRRIAQALGKPARLFPVPVMLLRLAGRLTGRSEEVERLVGSLQVDIRHTSEVLDWKPPISVEEGLRRAVSEGRA